MVGAQIKSFEMKEAIISQVAGRKKQTITYERLLNLIRRSGTSLGEFI